MNNNPLKQYFRRPAVFIKLPSEGKSYTPDVVDMPPNGELPVYPMTAIDEITSRTPDALFNGVAVVELIKSCIPAIKDPWKINSTDLDAVLIAIKSASIGDNMDVDSQCPNCEEISQYGISLMFLLSSIKASDYEKKLEIGDLKIKFKALNYKEINDFALENFEVQKKLGNLQKIENDDERNKATKEAVDKVTLLTMEIIAKTVEYIETPNMRVDQQEFVLDFLKNCDKNTFNTIKEYNAELKKQSEIKPVHLKCSHCNHEYDQQVVINPTDFFG